MEIIPLEPFDREYDIHELLKNIDGHKLLNTLTKLLGTDVRIVDLAGDIVLGDIVLGVSESPHSYNRMALTVQLEPVAYLESPNDNNLDAVAELLVELLKSSERYFMASELHLEAIHSDYEKLQQEQGALLASKVRYKELAESLELRVQEQVKTIENTQRNLFQTEKLASVGQLAAGVAHEINNPVGFILSNLNTARGYTGDITKYLELVKAGAAAEQLDAAWVDLDIGFILEDFKTLLSESIDGAERVTSIVADLKDFSNVDGKEVNRIDLNTVIKSVANVASTQIADIAELKVDLNKLPMLTCRPGHIAQVLLNMLLNSAKAIGDNGGVISIKSDSDGKESTITIRDDGCGISEEKLPNIFDPFFTTHDVGEGTGLGLSVARDVIVAHGGTIDVDSKLDEGTTFTIHLPVEQT